MHIRDLDDKCAGDENAGENNADCILVHRHVRQKYDLGEDET